MFYQASRKGNIVTALPLTFPDAASRLPQVTSLRFSPVDHKQDDRDKNDQAGCSDTAFHAESRIIKQAVPGRCSIEFKEGIFGYDPAVGQPEDDVLGKIPPYGS